MFFFAFPYAVSTSLSGTSIFSVRAFESRTSSAMSSSSTLSFAVSASSSDGGCVPLLARRNAFSTSSLVIALPSTAAQVSGDTGAGGSGAGCRHDAVTQTAATRAARRTLSVVKRAMIESAQYHMKPSRLALALSILAVAAPLAQAPPSATRAFDAVSVKRNKSGETRIRFETPKGRLTTVNVPLRFAIRQAYRVPESRIVGGPAWLDVDRFDIVATAGDEAASS